jgi:UPF0271 protein
MSPYLEINCDLGEGFSNDEEIMPLIDACNIACGGHAGNDKSIRKTIQLAKEQEVKIGVHPSFPDILNFGRKRLDLPFSTLRQGILLQLYLFKHIADQEEVKINHLKLHGALYNMAAEDTEMAKSVIKIIKEANFSGTIYAPAKSALAAFAKSDYDIVEEVFLDRAYNTDLSLVSRDLKGAVYQDKELVWEQYVRFKDHQSVKTINGEVKVIKAKTACIHGDTPNAVEQLKYIRENLE